MFFATKSGRPWVDCSIQAGVGVWTLLVLILALTTPRSGATQRPSGADSILHLFKGEGSRAEYPLRAVVRDSVSFARLWDQIATGPPPQVDFQRHMVIAVTMGAQGGTGNEIAIVGVDSSAHILQVRVDVTAWECIAGAMITHPAHVVRVPRSRLIVTFAERFRTVRCP